MNYHHKNWRLILRNLFKKPLYLLNRDSLSVLVNEFATHFFLLLNDHVFQMALLTLLDFATLQVELFEKLVGSLIVLLALCVGLLLEVILNSVLVDQEGAAVLAETVECDEHVLVVTNVEEWVLEEEIAEVADFVFVNRLQLLV